MDSRMISRMTLEWTRKSNVTRYRTSNEMHLVREWLFNHRHIVLYERHRRKNGNQGDCNPDEKAGTQNIYSQEVFCKPGSGVVNPDLGDMPSSID